MERTADAAAAALPVPAGRDGEGVGVRLDDGVEEGIEALDPREIGRRQLGARRFPGGQARPEVDDRRLEPRCVLVRVAPWLRLTVDPLIVPRPSAAPGIETTRVVDPGRDPWRERD